MAERNARSLDNLHYSYQFCQAMAKGSNFYNGISVTAKAKRSGIFAVYAWFTAIDAITDNQSVSVAARQIQLENFKKLTFSVLENPELAEQLFETAPYWLAFQDTVATFRIQHEYLEQMILGQEDDLMKYDYKTFSELYQYCRRVASMVGLVCMQVWGFSKKDHQVQQMIEWCGIAFQLTNILRDLKEDMRLGRVYIPAEYLNLPELTAKQLQQTDPQLILQAAQPLIMKAEIFYYNTQELYRYIDKDGRLSFLTMFNYYHALYKKIKENPARILEEPRISLSKWEKITLLMNAVIQNWTFHDKQSRNSKKSVR